VQPVHVPAFVRLRDGVGGDRENDLALLRAEGLEGLPTLPLGGDDIEELHSMRVSSRRLRAAMDAFEGAFPRKTFRPLLRQVKEITDVLGDARDLDVAIERLSASLADTPPDERPGIEGLVARYREARAAESPQIAALFARIEDEEFEERLTRYMAKHTGIELARLDPRPPED